MDLKPKTITLFHNFRIGNDFLDMTPKAQATKEKEKLISPKFKNCVNQQTIPTKYKDNPEKIFTNLVRD